MWAVEELAARKIEIDHTKLTSYALDFEHEILHNDVIVIGSDGVFDNLFDEQILIECI